MSHIGSMASSVINYPVVPFAIPVEGGVTLGKAVFIQGTVPYGADVFTVNLQSTASLSDSPRPETALHISVRMNQQVVVRNSFQNGQWDSEQRAGGMPFRQGDAFEIAINLDYDAYKIAVNGNHFTAFPYRMAKEVGSFLRVDGRVQISSVQFSGGASCPPCNGPAAPPYPGPPIPPYYNPVVPFYSNIGPLAPGRMVFISGVTYPHANHFAVNLQCGLHPGANIALHFNVRFHHAGDTRRVVRNHYEYGAWGSEDRSGTFPFEQNCQFDIIILAETNAFKVAVNNKHFTEFPHRIRPLMIVDSLTITDDVRLSLVRIQ